MPPAGTTISPFGTYQPPSVNEREQIVHAEERAGAEELTERTATASNTKRVAEAALPRRIEQALSHGPFCMAYASARPMMMQFVMIKPTKTESCLADLRTRRP